MKYFRVTLSDFLVRFLNSSDRHRRRAQVRVHVAFAGQYKQFTLPRTASLDSRDSTTCRHVYEGASYCFIYNTLYPEQLKSKTMQVTVTSMMTTSLDESGDDDVITACACTSLLRRRRHETRVVNTVGAQIPLYRLATGPQRYKLELKELVLALEFRIQMVELCANVRVVLSDIHCQCNNNSKNETTTKTDTHTPLLVCAELLRPAREQPAALRFSDPVDCSCCCCGGAARDASTKRGCLSAAQQMHILLPTTDAEELLAASILLQVRDRATRQAPPTGTASSAVVPLLTGYSALSSSSSSARTKVAFPGTSITALLRIVNGPQFAQMIGEHGTASQHGVEQAGDLVRGFPLPDRFVSSARDDDYDDQKRPQRARYARLGRGSTALIVLPVSYKLFLLRRHWFLQLDAWLAERQRQWEGQQEAERTQLAQLDDTYRENVKPLLDRAAYDQAVALRERVRIQRAKLLMYTFPLQRRELEAVHKRTTSQLRLNMDMSVERLLASST